MPTCESAGKRVSPQVTTLAIVVKGGRLSGGPDPRPACVYTLLARQSRATWRLCGVGVRAGQRVGRVRSPARVPVVCGCTQFMASSCRRSCKLCTAADGGAGVPIRWNFESFLISRAGEKSARFVTGTDITSASVTAQIEALLNAKDEI